MGLILLDFVVLGRVVSEVILQSLSTYKSHLEKGSETTYSLLTFCQIRMFYCDLN